MHRHNRAAIFMNIRTPVTDPFRFNAEQETEAICNRLRSALTADLRRRGYVIAMSGGVDNRYAQRSRRGPSDRSVYLVSSCLNGTVTR